MRILGVDPGSVITGWGLVSGDPRRPRLLESGVIRLGTTADFPSRLARLQRELTDVVDRVRPDQAAVESPFHGKSARSALQLAHARGVVLAVLAASGIEVTEYSPASVKKSVTGRGRAEKSQVRAMVAQLIAPAVVRGPEDLSDAVAVALCHGATAGYRAAISRVRVVAPQRRRETDP